MWWLNGSSNIGASEQAKSESLIRRHNQPVSACEVTLSPCHLVTFALTSSLPYIPPTTPLHMLRTPLNIHTLNSVGTRRRRLDIIISVLPATQRSLNASHMQGTHQQTSQAKTLQRCRGGVACLKPPQQPYARNNPRPQKLTQSSSCRRMQTYCSIQPS
jgi:hypothetical protein